MFNNVFRPKPIDLGSGLVIINPTPVDALKVAVLTPTYLAAYSTVNVIVACLKVARFFTSFIDIYPISRANQGLQYSIDSLNKFQEKLQINIHTGLVPGYQPVILSSGSATPSSSLLDSVSSVKEKIEEKVSLKKLLVAAVVIGILYQTNAFGLIGNNTSLPNIPVPPRIRTDEEIIGCLSSYSAAESFEEAKRVFKCGNFPSGSAKEVQKAFRQLAIKIHPDKGGDPVTMHVLKGAKDLLEKVYSTPNGQSAVRMYECLSRIPASVGRRAQASEVFQCLDISLRNVHSCASLQRATNNALERIHWMGEPVVRRVHDAFWTFCLRG